MNIFQQAWDWICSGVNNLVEGWFNSTYNSFHGAISWCFSGFEKQLNDAVDVIVNGGDLNSVLGGTAQLVNEAITPIAYTILACGFLWELYEMWQRKQDNIDFQDIVKASVKLLIIKAIIPFLPAFLDIIHGTVSPIYANILANGEISFTGISDNVADTLLSTINGDENWLYILWLIVWNFLKMILGAILSLVLRAVAIYFYVVAYLRDFEIVMLNAMSAIPVIFAIYGETKDVPKRFLFSYGQVVLQGLLLIIVIVMYNALLVSYEGQGLWELVISSVIAWMAVGKTNQWAGKILGQG